MEIFSLRALWKGLRGRSLVFSLVFAMAMTGFSLAGILRIPLRTVGIWAPLLFILPIVAIGLLARHERKLQLRDDFKRSCSYILVFGSILLSLLLWRYQARLEKAYADSIQPGPLYKEKAEPARPRGPRHRP